MVLASFAAVLGIDRRPGNVNHDGIDANEASQPQKAIRALACILLGKKARVNLLPMHLFGKRCASLAILLGMSTGKLDKHMGRISDD